MNPLSELLAGRDRWTGAACIGQWDKFDPPGEREDDPTFLGRVQAAQRVCGGCPILAECRDFAGNARPRERAGIWGGVPYDSSGRPVRIPKESK